MVPSAGGDFDRQRSDSSTAIGYLGPPGEVAANILFQSYAGGGDVQGIAIPALQPGDFITCVWSGGHPGDTATLRIIGAHGGR